MNQKTGSRMIRCRFCLCSVSIALCDVIIRGSGGPAVEQGPELTGGTAFLCFEGPVESRDTGKTGLQGYVGDGQIQLCQQDLSRFDPSADEVIVEGTVHVLLKEPCKVELGETAVLRNLIQGQVIGVVLIDILKDTV